VSQANQETFSDAGLVLFGHGSTVNAKSSEPVFQHAAELRRRGLFKEVREAYWKQEPSLKDVIAQVKTPRLFLAPLFISDGYFSDELIPAELGFRAITTTAGEAIDPNANFQRVAVRADQTLFYCRAIGSHPRMGDVILHRAQEVAAKFPFPRAPRPEETTLFIAGHGTEQNRNSRAAIDLQVERLRAEKVYAAVHAVFMDENPRISESYRLCETKNMIVVPFFISDGMHVEQDIPVLLGEAERIVRQRLEKGAAAWRNPTEKNGRLVWYTASAGTDPSVADVILERVREAAHWTATV
jgi:sirohydrochlorin cobaltochelatase